MKVRIATSIAALAFCVATAAAPAFAQKLENDGGPMVNAPNNEQHGQSEQRTRTTRPLYNQTTPQRAQSPQEPCYGRSPDDGGVTNCKFQ
jgi:hypothetical protein